MWFDADQASTQRNKNRGFSRLVTGFLRARVARTIRCGSLVFGFGRVVRVDRTRKAFGRRFLIVKDPGDAGLFKLQGLVIVPGTHHHFDVGIQGFGIFNDFCDRQGVACRENQKSCRSNMRLHEHHGVCGIALNHGPFSFS